MKRVKIKMQSWIFCLTVFLIDNTNANLTLCKIFKIETDFDTETLKETKKCLVNENGASLENNSECIAVHEFTTTKLNIKNKIANEEKVNVELNNMNLEKPLTWNVKVDIDNKSKTLINLGSELIKVSCSNIDNSKIVEKIIP